MSVVFEEGQRLRDTAGNDYEVIALRNDPWRTHSQKLYHDMQIRRADGETRWVSLDLAERMHREGQLFVLVS